jgi:hypothetical protein
MNLEAMVADSQYMLDEIEFCLETLKEFRDEVATIEALGVDIDIVDLDIAELEKDKENLIAEIAKMKAIEE